MTTREELHRLIEELPEHDVQRLLSNLRGQGGNDLPSLLRAADEDEATEDELAALAEVTDDFAADHLVSHQEIRREFAA